MKKIFVILITIFQVLIFASMNIHTIEADELGDVKIHGFVSQGYLKSDHNNYLADTEEGTFQFNETGINFSTNLTDKLRMGMQLFARDQGNINNDEVVLDWAYADYHWNDWLGLRAGKMKGPLGLYNEYRDTDLLRTCILLPPGVYSENDRDSVVSVKGIGLYGYIRLNFIGSLSYLLQYGTSDLDPDGGTAKVFESQGIYDPDLGFLPAFEINNFNVDDVSSISLKWDTPLDGLRLGYTFFDTDIDVDVMCVLEAIENGDM